jgi:hypothetical protein
VTGKNSLRLMNLALLPLPDTKLFQLNIAYSSLTAPIFKLVRHLQTKLIPDHTVSFIVFRITGQVVELLSV